MSLMDTAMNTPALRERFVGLEAHLNRRIIGQPALNRRLLLALLGNGHLLVEGAPGLAKTRAIKELSTALHASFHRVQFTPDLLPADLTGTDIYRPTEGRFEFQKGPLFHNLLLADEINRAPAKVQSALLEAMAERQITVGSTTYPLPDLFLVMATQNPIEQEGTYALPEAQLDRFLLHVQVGYPDAAAELAILKLNRGEALHEPATPFEPLSQAEVMAAREACLRLYMAPEIEQYIVELVMATRSPGRYAPDLERWIEYGASPRGTLALDACARAQAFMQGRDFVGPDDVQTVITDVLRHRVLLSYSAEADGISSDTVLMRLLTLVAVP